MCASGNSDGRLSPSELREPVCATTAPDGGYRLVELYPIRWTLDAWAPRYRPAEWTSPPPALAHAFDLAPGEERHGVDITLDPNGVEVRGLVKDVGGGPIAGARVIVQAAGFMMLSGEGIAANTRSDEKGEFSVWVRPGPLVVRAEAEGYSGGMRASQAPGPIVTVLLVPETVIAGQVVEAGSGTPVADVAVAARATERTLGEIRGGSALSDAEGA